MTALVVQDASEVKLPKMGLIELQDAESGEIYTVDTSSEAFRTEYMAEMKRRKEMRDRLLQKAQEARVEISSSGNYVNPLIRFFKSRHR